MVNSKLKEKRDNEDNLDTLRPRETDKITDCSAPIQINLYKKWIKQQYDDALKVIDKDYQTFMNLK